VNIALIFGNSIIFVQLFSEYCTQTEMLESDSRSDRHMSIEHASVQ